MDDETRGRFDQLDKQLRGVLARLDEIEGGIDLLASKIDRQAVMGTTAMQSAEQALTSLTAVSRRVARLEAKDE